MSSRVDYCNGLFTGLPKKTIKQLQLVKTARVLTKTKRTDHITPTLKSLSHRIDFNALLLVYKWLTQVQFPATSGCPCKLLWIKASAKYWSFSLSKSLNRTGLNHLSGMFQEYTPARALTSLERRLLVIPSVRATHEDNNNNNNIFCQSYKWWL